MITKKGVKDYVSKYISYSDDKETIIPCETLTRYVCYDKSLIEQDKQTIIRYLIENFGIDNINISLDRLCVTRDNITWNDLKDMSDVNILEDLLGLGIATGLIIDDLRMRFAVFARLGGDNLYLCPELCPDLIGREIDGDFELEYVEYMKKEILPLYSFGIDRKKLEDENKVSFTDEEKRELMRFWFYQINELNVDEDAKRIFEILIKDDVERVINAAVLIRLMKKGPETFYINMKMDPSQLFIENLNRQIRSFDSDKRAYFEDVKKVFLTEIDRIKREYKNGHKKTL